ncbi:MAG: TfoX/Sxy family protein [Planctomycetaceae bacterium]
MAYSESLAGRLRDVLAGRRGIVEKKMFGGVVFLLDGNMLVGVWKDSLIARLGPQPAADALTEPHVGVFDVTGRPMRNWVLIEPDGIEEDRALAKWVERAMNFVRTLPPKSPDRTTGPFVDPGRA